jgi:quercetin dioxygenase-like cupin family protein
MAEHDARAIIRPPGEGETIENTPGGAVTLKVRGEQSNGAMTAFETVAAPGEGPPLHLHDNEDELLYSLEGTFRFRVEDEVQEVSTGTVVFIPRRVRHAWQNSGEAPGRLLVIFAPAGFETFFERWAELPADAPSAEEFRRLGSEVGMTVVGPPLAESNPL